MRRRAATVRLERFRVLGHGAGSCFDEPPQPAPDAGQVRTRALTGEHPGQTLGGHRVPQRAAFGCDGRHRDDLVAGSQDTPQRLVPPGQRLAEQRPAVDVKQVERQEGDGPSRASLEPCRHRGRIRAPRRIDDHEFPVQHRRPGIDPDGQASQLAQIPGEVGAILVNDADDPAPGQVGGAHVDQRAAPAPPRLEQVLVRIEWLGEGPRQHRPEVGQARQDRLLGLEPERELVGHRRRW